MTRVILKTRLKLNRLPGTSMDEEILLQSFILVLPVVEAGREVFARKARSFAFRAKIPEKRPLGQ